jgi:hypothetical protein
MKWIFVLVILLSGTALYPFQIPAQKQLIVSTKVSQSKNTRPPTPPKPPSGKFRPVNRRPNGLGAASISAPKPSENP